MKPRQRGALAPVELTLFVRSDWERDDDTNHFDAFRAWKSARAEWIAAHPDSLALGNAAERFRLELQTQMTQYDPRATDWHDYERGGSSFAWDDPSKPERFSLEPGQYGQYPRRPQPPKQSRRKRKQR